MFKSVAGWQGIIIESRQPRHKPDMLSFIVNHLSRHKPQGPEAYVIRYSYSDPIRIGMLQNSPDHFWSAPFLSCPGLEQMHPNSPVLFGCLFIRYNRTLCPHTTLLLFFCVLYPNSRTNSYLFRAGIYRP